jgi:hypothetical protein
MNDELLAKTMVWPELMVKVCPVAIVMPPSTPSTVPGNEQLDEMVCVPEMTLKQFTAWVFGAKPIKQMAATIRMRRDFFI